MRGRPALRWILMTAMVTAVVCAVPADAQVASTQRNLAMQCSFCHSLHGAPGGFLLQDVDTTTLCLSCHDPNATGSSLKVTVHTNTGSSNYAYDPTNFSNQNPDGGVNYWVGCLNCHNPHYNLVNIRGLTADGHVNDGAGNLLDDPPPPAGSVTEGQYNDCTDTEDSSKPARLNSEICNNFKLLGAIRDDVNGAKILTPGISDTQANCIATGGTPVIENSVYVGCARTHLIGRREPLTVGKGQTAVTYNDWVRDSSDANGAYIGMCQTCHTRTQHHRNNDGLIWPGPGPLRAYDPVADRTHNADRRCTDCHQHDLGFSKGQ